MKSDAAVATRRSVAGVEAGVGVEHVAVVARLVVGPHVAVAIAIAVAVSVSVSGVAVAVSRVSVSVPSVAVSVAERLGPECIAGLAGPIVGTADGDESEERELRSGSTNDSDASHHGICTASARERARARRSDGFCKRDYAIRARTRASDCS